MSIGIDEKDYSKIAFELIYDAYLKEVGTGKKEDIVHEKQKTISKLLFVYIKQVYNNIIKGIMGLPHLLKSHWDLRTNTESFRDLTDLTKFVMLYGMLGELVLITFCGYPIAFVSMIHLLGAGALIYLFHDTLDYMFSVIRGRNKSRR